ncbi:MAG TPA: hypothetical protein PLN01_03690 [Spirochaetota bacterium]|nr:hypothetical protein [Spirochaetota bacterium]
MTQRCHSEEAVATEESLLSKNDSILHSVQNDSPRFRMTVASLFSFHLDNYNTAMHNSLLLSVCQSLALDCLSMQ